MDLLTTDFILIFTCFILTVAALLSIFRSHGLQMSMADHEMLRRFIRSEVFAIHTGAKQQEFVDALEKSVVPFDLDGE